MKFNELQKGRIYTDKDGVRALRFDGMYNDHLAEFTVCEYDEDKGEFVATDEVLFFNNFEVTDLI